MNLGHPESGLGREQRFVLFPLGKKRFALPAERVSELSKPDRLQTFPHTTRLLTGVLVRRGKIIPVCDLAPVLLGSESPKRKFFLIASSQLDGHWETTAIPVSGECELISGIARHSTGRLPAYVSGLLSLADEIVQIIDLEKLVAMEGKA